MAWSVGVWEFYGVGEEYLSMGCWLNAGVELIFISYPLSVIRY
jgi:hypothetical protein